MSKSQPEFVTFLHAELEGIADLMARRFFGGWQLRAGNAQFAIVMNGTLFFRVEGELRKILEEDGSRPFSYAESGKQVSVPKYMSAPEGALDDLDLLRAWVQRVIAAT
ncbi:MAG: TfoX/Sxy family protein [Rhodobacteraceae bacterium]|nr:TfoX/Sxy family protein [Paracoccaceae bacterium]